MATWNTLDIEVTSAAPTNLLNAANQMQISLCNVCYIDQLHLSASISGGDYLRLKKYADKHGDTLKISNQKGLFYYFFRLLNRPILIIGFLLWIFLVIYLPTRVLFVYVDGNAKVSTSEIIDAAERCGVKFGASRRYVRSEKVKNALLSEIEDLQWAGINTNGCVAVISVKERETPEKKQFSNSVNNIIASRDGVISSITVRSGNVVCKQGQAVRKGQLLVSGYTDCGLWIKRQTADAEIFALTSRSVTAIAMKNVQKRSILCKKDSRIYVQLGKNIIKLYDSSGISYDGCVKMYKQIPIMLPGGFALPVSLHVETVYLYDSEAMTLPDITDTEWIKRAVQGYMQGNLIAGEIQQIRDIVEVKEDAFYYTGSYVCQEMIGKVQIEEIMK